MTKSWSSLNSGCYFRPHRSNSLRVTINLSITLNSMREAKRILSQFGSKSYLSFFSWSSVKILGVFFWWEAWLDKAFRRTPSSIWGSSGYRCLKWDILVLLLFWTSMESFFFGSSVSRRKSSSSLDELTPFFLLLNLLMATLREYFKLLLFFEADSVMIFLYVSSLNGMM